MCGRLKLDHPDLVQLVTEYFGPDINLQPSPTNNGKYYSDIMPRGVVPCLVYRDGSLTIIPKIWGWKEKGDTTLWYNARSETVLRPTSSLWTSALNDRTRRCVVLCTGFYEKNKLFVRKYPLVPSPVQPLVLPALIKDDRVSVLTVEADTLVSPFHHRMPVAVSQWQGRYKWLDPNSGQSDWYSLLMDTSSRIPLKLAA